jgi:hypothetical protein
MVKAGPLDILDRGRFENKFMQAFMERKQFLQLHGNRNTGNRHKKGTY